MIQTHPHSTTSSSSNKQHTNNILKGGLNNQSPTNIAAKYPVIRIFNYLLRIKLRERHAEIALPMESTNRSVARFTILIVFHNHRVSPHVTD